MAFGKIAVKTGSGEIEEYELTKPTTSVGRQPGNDIVLPTSAVSRYHAQFVVEEGGVSLVDLGTVNGTFVNDRMLDPNGRVQLEDGDTILIGDMQLRFFLPGARSGSKKAAVSLTPEARPIEARGLPFRLLLDEPQQSVAPGARLQLTLIIENMTDDVHAVGIEVGGLEAEWVKTNRREANLEPGEQVQVMISVRPPRDSATRPGVYPLTVRVQSKENPADSLEAVREIDVVGYGGLGLAVRPGKSNGLYHIAAQNQGNVPADIDLSGFQPERRLRFRINPSRLKLAPGETRQATLTVQPAGGRSFSASREVSFALVAHSHDKAGYHAPLALTYTLSPSWPRWLLGIGLPMLLGAAVVIAVVVGVLYYLGIVQVPPLPVALPFGLGLPTATATEEGITDALPNLTIQPGPTPTLLATPVASIETFTAGPEEVIFQTRGDVLLRWESTGATNVRLLGPDGKELPLSAGDLSTNRYEAPVSTLLLGENTFTLTVVGEDRQERSRTAVVRVVAPICTVGPTTRAFTEPDPASPPAPPFSADQVIVMGRTVDALWLRIAYNELDVLGTQGWVPAYNVTCEQGSPPVEDFLPLEDVVSQPPPSPTPTP